MSEPLAIFFFLPKVFGTVRVNDDVAPDGKSLRNGRAFTDHGQPVLSMSVALLAVLSSPSPTLAPAPMRTRLSTTQRSMTAPLDHGVGQNDAVTDEAPSTHARRQHAALDDALDPASVGMRLPPTCALAPSLAGGALLRRVHRPSQDRRLNAGSSASRLMLTLPVSPATVPIVGPVAGKVLAHVPFWRCERRHDLC